MQGTVKWFSNKKGYGFIIGEDGNEYFAHFSKIIAKGYKSLEQGATVNFDIEESDNGVCAANIKAQ